MTEQSLLFRYLSDCYTVPGPDLLESVTQLLRLLEPLDAEMAAAAIEMQAALADEGADEKLRVDYTRLFIGPFELLAPPYESVYHGATGRVIGPSTQAVMQLVRAAGFDLADGFSEAPDHIAAELEFAYILQAEHHRHTAEGETAAAERYGGLLTELLTDHLCGWVPQLTARMAQHADSPFYRHLAKLTDRLVEQATLSHINGANG